MDKVALSIKNPISYLVASGIKWVENRSWNTEYRGRIYIHSSTMNDYTFIGSEVYPAELPAELSQVQKELKGKEADIPYIEKYVKKHGEERWFDIASFDDGLQRLYGFYRKNYGPKWEAVASDMDAQKSFFRNHDKMLRCLSIIGHVDLVNVMKDCKSVWAEPGMYHWILDNPVLYDKPIVNVKGKLRFFDVSHVDFPDD